jgi:type IV secretory pathway VirB2 component (pilin)
MHGIIIHYDPLTHCGLLRTKAGQVQYFRLDEVVSEGLVAAGQPVALRHGVLVDTGGSQFDINPPARPLAPQPVSVPVQVRSGRGMGWLGSLLSLGALVLLLLSGGQSNGYSSPNPKLIESLFGAVAATLLVIEAVFFFINATGSRGRIRWMYWLVVWASLFAYVGAIFDGFEADDATGWYAYALLSLGFAVYILPYRSK